MKNEPIMAEWTLNDNDQLEGVSHTIVGKGEKTGKVFLLADLYPIDQAYIGKPDVRGDAIARLMVAAPQLLELVEGFEGSGVEWDGPTCSYVTMQVDRERLKEARALIAVIRGKQ